MKKEDLKTETAFYYRDDLELVLWNDIINVVFTDDLKSASTEFCLQSGLGDHLKDRVVVGQNASYSVLMDESGNYMYLLLMFDINKFDVGKAAHESLHATFHAMERKGITYSESSEEAYAYTIAHIAQKVMDIHKEARKQYIQYKKENK